MAAGLNNASDTAAVASDRRRPLGRIANRPRSLTENTLPIGLSFETSSSSGRIRPNGQSVTHSAAHPLTLASSPLPGHSSIHSVTSIDASAIVLYEISSVSVALKKSSCGSSSGGVAALFSASIDIEGSRDRSNIASIWGLRTPVSRIPEDPIAAEFDSLKACIKSKKGLKGIDANRLLQPFLAAIMAPKIECFVSMLALNSIQRFINYDIINEDSEQITAALQRIIHGVTHTKFDSFDSSAEEHVLLLVLEIIRLSLYKFHYNHLSDESICEIVETCLSICCQSKLAEILRKSGENVLILTIRVVFMKLKEIPVIPEHYLGTFSSKINNEIVISNDDTLENTIDLETELRRARNPTESQEDSQKEPFSDSEEKTTESVPFDKQSAQTGAVNDTEKEGVLSSPPVNESVKSSKGLLEDTSSANKNIKIDSEREKTSNEFEARAIENSVSNTKHSFLWSDSDVQHENDNKTEKESNNGIHTTLRPFGLGSMREILRVLVQLLDDRGKKNEIIQLMALKILNAILETAGTEVGNQPYLREFFTHDMCKYLLPLLRSESPVVLKFSLQILVSLVYTMRKHLKLQQEVMIGYLLNCLLIKPRTSMDQAVESSRRDSASSHFTHTEQDSVPDKKFPGFEGELRSSESLELMLEYLSRIAQIDGFLIDLYVNYDSSPNFGNLFSDFITFLTQNVVSRKDLPNDLNIASTCLECLFFIIDTIYEELGKPPQIRGCPNPEQLRENVRLKEIIKKACAKFNDDPRAGADFIVQEQLIDGDQQSQAMSQFLYDNYSVNKRVLGEFLSRPSQSRLLKNFVNLFDFKDRRVDEALREILQAFRLPGESQQIERILEAFAERYMESSPRYVATADATFVLSYSTVMLNVDQHKPNLKARMSFQDFTRNLRGLNDGKDFDEGFLQEIYSAIQKNEIIMAEEHDSRESFNIAWMELIQRSERVDDFVLNDTNWYNEQIFREIWPKIVGKLAFVFKSATEDNTFSRIIDAFIQIAQIASSFNVPGAIDHILICLEKISVFAKLKNEALNRNIAVDTDSGRIVVSTLSVIFGGNLKAQVATIVIFRICDKYQLMIRKAWKQIFKIIASLFVNSLMQCTAFPIHRFFALEPLKVPTLESKGMQARLGGGSGFFSAISSYLSYSEDANMPTSAEIERTLCCLDCIRSCHIDSFFQKLFASDVRSQDVILGAIFDEVLRKLDSAHQVDEQGDAVPVQFSLLYNIMFALEIAISISLKDVDHFQAGAAGIYKIIEGLLQQQALVESRTMFSRLLRYLLGLAKTELFFKQKILDANEILQQVHTALRARQGKDKPIDWPLIVHGLASCLESSSDGQMAHCASIFEILRLAPVSTELVEINVKMTEQIVNDHLDASNLSDVIGVLKRQIEHAFLFKASNDRQRPQYSSASKTSEESTTKLKFLGLKIVDQLYTMCGILPRISSGIAGDIAWSEQWKPTLQMFCVLSVCTLKEVRVSSVRSMQRVFISVLTLQSAQETFQVYEEILFPLLNRTMRLENGQVGRRDFTEILSLVINLQFKVFLHYFMQFPTDLGSNFHLWDKLLSEVSVCKKYCKSEELVAEAIGESVKNILLVMDSSGIPAIQRAKDGEQEEKSDESEVEVSENATRADFDEGMWVQTWQKLEALVPNLRGELSLNVATS